MAPMKLEIITAERVVYSDEVINNILESYPVYPLLAALTVIAEAQLPEARMVAVPIEVSYLLSAASPC